MNTYAKSMNTYAKSMEDLRKEYETYAKSMSIKEDHLIIIQGLPDVLRFSRVHNAMHPTQKARRFNKSTLILTCSRPNDFCSSSFAGSGTECAMAVKKKQTIGLKYEKHAKCQRQSTKYITSAVFVSVGRSIAHNGGDWRRRGFVVLPLVNAQMINYLPLVKSTSACFYNAMLGRFIYEKNIGFKVTVEFDCTDMIDEKHFTMNLIATRWLLTNSFQTILMIVRLTFRR